ncbi:hypothetical protein DZA28_00670 [Pseudomonas alloputida]|uniref:Uncharacterized protein n=1 Tax=Pseudomonas alloputida TaxID=1940621 RepID=A0ABY3D557_9PSED|nr:hypothetical protein CQW32_16205 [Pseudomonas putida]TRZ58536.1 hypothetical protein DZA28_00670 [Pseudomonas alloputida]
MGSQRKRTPGCNGLDRGWNITPRETGQTSAWSSAAMTLTETVSSTSGLASLALDLPTLTGCIRPSGVRAHSARVVSL